MEIFNLNTFDPIASKLVPFIILCSKTYYAEWKKNLWAKLLYVWYLTFSTQNVLSFTFSSQMNSKTFTYLNCHNYLERSKFLSILFLRWHITHSFTECIIYCRTITLQFFLQKSNFYLLKRRNSSACNVQRW